MFWGKTKENVIRVLPRKLRGKRGKFLFKGHDALYWRTRWTEVRLMKFWRV